MFSITIILLLFFVFTTLTLLSKPVSIVSFTVASKSKKIPTLFLIVIGICMIITAVFRPEGMPDRNIYLDNLLSLSQDNEIGYNYIEYITYNYLNKDFLILLLIMALLSIPIKLISIIEMSNLIWGSLLIYLSSKFILQDMIQMRAAVATGIFLYCCKFKLLSEWKKYFIGMGIGILFHWSALLMVPIWFLKTDKLKSWIYIMGIVISFICGYIGLYVTDSLNYVPIPAINILYQGYLSTNDIQSEFNLFSIVILSKIALTILLLANSQKLRQKNIAFIFMIKVYAISFMIYALFSNVTVAAIRLSEFYQIVEVILLPILCLLFDNKTIGKLSVVGIASIYLIFNIVIASYIS